MVANLLNNACKFTDNGGRVWLAVDEKQGEAVVRVRDSGVGIAAEHLSRVFEMFAQVDTSLERSRGGLGIGKPVDHDILDVLASLLVVETPARE